MILKLDYRIRYVFRSQLIIVRVVLLVFIIQKLKLLTNNNLYSNINNDTIKAYNWPTGTPEIPLAGLYFINVFFSHNV